MKKNKFLSAALILLILVIAFGTTVSAAICNKDRDPDYEFSFTLSAGMYKAGEKITNPLTRFMMDKKTGYCVTPQVISEDGIDYGKGSASWTNIPANLHKLNDSKQRNIELIAVYGWELSSKTKADALYTKIYICEQASDMKLLTINGPGVSMTAYNKWKATINKKINSYIKVNPSFNGSTQKVTVGSTMTIEDTNNVLSEYTITDIPKGLTAKISGNKLVVTAAQDYAGGTISLKRLYPYRGTSLYYFATKPDGVWRQGIITPAILNPKEAKLRLDSIQATGNFRLAKTDNFGARLPGAEFKLQDKNGKTVLTFSMTSGEYTSRNFAAGTYTLYETKAPTRYALDPQPRQIIIKGGATNAVHYNKPIKNALQQVKIRIIKTDESGQSLSGVNFAIKAANKVVATLTTDSNGIAESQPLPQGSYIVVESQAPNGYVKSEERKILLQGDNSGKAVLVQELTISNDLTATEISKVDATTGEELPGAKLTVKEKESGEVVESWTSTDKPHVIKGLHQGKTYILTEDLAPLGYTLAQDVEFTVDNKHGVVNKVAMKNELTVTEISKVDATAGEELPGAKLTVKEKESGEVVESWTSTDKPHVIKGLHQGKTYILTEDLAPLGYTLAQDVEFTVDNKHGVVNKVAMKNELTVTEISKVDATAGEEL
ncbi:MAG TPA: hypothetical protein GXX72_08590, partial [Clostridiaceae bacterium]|nr:hypothetical protein [Clostridiaceae bacterium]